MVKTGKQIKSERRRAHAEARASERRRRERRRWLAWGIGAAAAIAAAAIVVVTLVRAPDERSDAAGVSTNEVVVDAPARSEPLVEGDMVPSFSAPALGGGRVSWETYAGRPAVLAVWAPWCPHCQDELPVLDAVMREHPDIAFVTVVTAVDAQPGPTPEDYLRDEGLEFPVAMDDGAGTIASALGIQGFPTLYFVGSDGRVAVAATGEVDEPTLHEVLASLA